MRHPALVTVSVLLAVSLGGGAWLLHTRGQARAEMQAQVEEMKKKQEAAAARASVLEGDVATLRAQLAEKGIEPAVAARPTGLSAEEAKRLEAVRELSQTQTRLTAASASVVELQNRVSELEASVERLGADNRRLGASEGNLKEDLENTKNVVAAMEAEIKAKNERLAQVDGALRKAREEMAAQGARTAAGAGLAGDLADVNRRRENTLVSLQRRYRDITDQLRALAVRLDTQRDNPTAAVPDISRIQSAVQLAEDDLRQLSGFNAQAARLMQRMTGK